MNRKIKFDLYKKLAFMSDKEVKEEYLAYSFCSRDFEFELLYYLGYPPEVFRKAEKAKCFYDEYCDMLESVVRSRKIYVY